MKGLGEVRNRAREVELREAAHVARKRRWRGTLFKAWLKQHDWKLRFPSWYFDPEAEELVDTTRDGAGTIAAGGSGRTK